MAAYIFDRFPAAVSASRYLAVRVCMCAVISIQLCQLCLHNEVNSAILHYCFGDSYSLHLCGRFLEVT